MVLAQVQGRSLLLALLPQIGATTWQQPGREVDT